MLFIFSIFDPFHKLLNITIQFYINTLSLNYFKQIELLIYLKYRYSNYNPFFLMTNSSNQVVLIHTFHRIIPHPTSFFHSLSYIF